MKNKVVKIFVIALLLGAITTWETQFIQDSPTVQFGIIIYGWPLGWYHAFVNYVTGGIENYATIIYTYFVADVIVYTILWILIIWSIIILWNKLRHNSG